jgi:leucyl-tRNA synthetase
VSIRVFTTQPDTVYGVTFLAVSSDHEILRGSTVLDKSQQLEELRSISNASDGVKQGEYAVYSFPTE